MIGYIRYIEKELGRLKQENKKLCEMHDPARKKPPPPPRHPQGKQAKCDPQVAHVLKTALGNTVMYVY